MRKLRKWFFNNLANIITTARLIFSVWVVILAVYGQQLFLMFILVVLCGLTDMIDGWLARRYRIESQIGGILDRMADKIFICPTTLILIGRFLPEAKIVAFWRFLTIGLVAVIILLEILLAIGGVLGVVRGLDISSNQWGRKKMVFQSAAVLLWFLSLLIESCLKIEIFRLSIYFINAICIIAVYLAIKSIKGYFQRWEER